MVRAESLFFVEPRKNRTYGCNKTIDFTQPPSTSVCRSLRQAQKQIIVTLARSARVSAWLVCIVYSGSAATQTHMTAPTFAEKVSELNFQSLPNAKTPVASFSSADNTLPLITAHLSLALTESTRPLQTRPTFKFAQYQLAHLISPQNSGCAGPRYWLVPRGGVNVRI